MKKYSKNEAKNIGIALVFLAISSFVVRLIAIFILRFNINPSVWEYDSIALNILSGKGYVYQYLSTDYLFFGYPLFPYLSAISHFLTERNYFILEIFQAMMAAIVILPLGLIAKKIFGYKTAILTGLMYCFHPGLIVYAGKIHEFTMTVFFITVISYLIICGKTRVLNLIIIGLLIGLGILLRPIFVLFLPAYLIYLILTYRKIRPVILKFSLVALLAAVIISPWIYRGYSLYHRFIFITTSSAEHFWRGNNINASGTALTKDRKDILSTADGEFRNKLFSLNEIGQHNFFKQQAFLFIKNNPLGFVKITVKKFIYFWFFSPQTGFEYPSAWLCIYKAIYIFLISGILSSVYFIFKNIKTINWPAIIFIALFCLLLSMVHSLYYVETRHRWMIEPLLLMMSSYGFIKFSEAK